ncbi:YcxB family protein, partial [Dysgonomonas sp. OttesenSCG-928-M03]|nr:YcxB family protein [Dysgonomonas sp. OttesenSCG-928-M03]
MVEPPITISVKLTENDLVDFYTHNARRSILMKLMIVCALLIFFGQLIRILVIPQALYEGSWKWLLAVVGLFFLMYYMNKSNAQKEFKRNKRLQESHYYVISDDSIHIKGGAFNTIFQWDKLHGMTETKKCFFIWLGKNSAQIIPKREMSVEEVEWLS